MQWAKGFLIPVIGCAFLIGCASSDVEKMQSNVENETIAQPSRIVVGEFTASPERIGESMEAASYFEAREEPITPEEIELGRALGERVEENLVANLRDLGIAAERQAAAGELALNDALIEGYFVTVNEGSQLQRMLIGFGMGAAELRTLVQVQQKTATGLRTLGLAEIEAEGGNLPGMLVPVGIGAATGNVVKSAAISGGVAAVKEVGPETIEAAAERTASEISALIEQGYEKRGWR